MLFHADVDADFSRYDVRDVAKLLLLHVLVSWPWENLYSMEFVDDPHRCGYVEYKKHWWSGPILTVHSDFRHVQDNRRKQMVTQRLTDQVCHILDGIEEKLYPGFTSMDTRTRRTIPVDSRIYNALDLIAVELVRQIDE